MVADGTEGDRQSLSPEQQLILTTVGRELPSRQFANLKARGKWPLRSEAESQLSQIRIL